VKSLAPTALIAGLGKSGLSAARHLAAQGWRLRATDTRTEPPGVIEFRALAPGAQVGLGALDANLLDDASLVVASPGLSLREPLFTAARARGIDVVGDVELFARAVKSPTVGITGTNGKSTVTTLLGKMAERDGIRVRVGGNLGTPALDLLGDTATQLYVLELSSYQLEAAPSLRLRAATVLNVTEDHRDRYATMSDYATAKAAIFAHCDVAVLNAEDETVVAMGTGTARRHTFAVLGKADYRIERQRGEDWLVAPDGPLLATKDMRIHGRHNAANALAAVALGDACGVSRGAMCAELREFKGLPHRAEWVRELRGVTYINDSKATNVGATLAAVAGMAGPLLVIAGGDGKQQDFSPLAGAFRGKVRKALLIGRDAAVITAALAGSCEVQQCSSLEEAVQVAGVTARPGDTVLLSPACASLDMFRDYAHRGQVFMERVRGLPA
jgi:UDP-N-acetylmuramoylalanine--D-glutamate ligase